MAELSEKDKRISVLKQLGLLTADASPLMEEMILTSLNEFSNEQLIEAVGDHMTKSPYAPKVNDVFDYFRAKQHLDQSALEAKANGWYNLLNSDIDAGAEYVVSDARAAFAFKQCFVNIQEFGRHPLSADPFDRKAFVKAYVEADPAWIGRGDDAHVIHGLYRDTPNPKVKYVGSHEACRKLALAYFGTTGQAPRLPAPPAQKQLTCAKTAAMPSVPEKQNKPEKTVGVETVLKTLNDIKKQLKA